MSNPTGVVNVQRRTWDEEEFARRARERAERGDDYEEEGAAVGKRSRKEEFEPAPSNAEGPARSKRAYLKARTEKVDYEAKLGKTQVVTSATALSNASGYFCEVCKCVLKDNLNYLDHINGKKHQRALGYSMRVERSTVDQIRNRLGNLKSKEQDAASSTRPNAREEYDARVKAQEEEEERQRRARKEAKADAKRKEQAAAAAGAAGDEDDGLDPEMAAMMGFGGFGGGKR